MNDYSDPVDRWRFLSKELALKQEIINRAKKDLEEKNIQLRDKAQEMVKLKKEDQILYSELFELQEELKQEITIQNQVYNPFQEYPNLDGGKGQGKQSPRIAKIPTPNQIDKMSVDEIKHQIFKSCHELQTLTTGNKAMKEKIRKCAIQVSNIEKVKNKLKEKREAQLSKQKELQRLQEMKARIAKFKAISAKQEQIICQLETSLETVLTEKGKKEQNEVVMSKLHQDIAQIEDRLNEAQYGEQAVIVGQYKDPAPSEDASYQGLELLGEEKEIDRIQTESIPKLQSLLSDLQAQIKAIRANPVVQFAAIPEEGTPQQDSLQSPDGFQSKKQQLYFNEYFKQDATVIRDGEEDRQDQNLFEGNWIQQKAQLESQIEMEEERKKQLEMTIKVNQRQYEDLEQGLLFQINQLKKKKESNLRMMDSIDDQIRQFNNLA